MGEINVTIPIICQVTSELHFFIIGKLVIELSALILNKEGFLIFCMNRLSFESNLNQLSQLVKSGHLIYSFQVMEGRGGRGVRGGWKIAFHHNNFLFT